MTTKKRWLKDVKTDSTHPPEGLFTKSPEKIARSLASKRVSPQRPGMRMHTYYINRAGKGLSASQRTKLERTKKLLSEKMGEQKNTKKPVKFSGCTASGLSVAHREVTRSRCDHQCRSWSSHRPSHSRSPLLSLQPLH